MSYSLYDNPYPHLDFTREEISSERRKKPGYPGPKPNRGGRELFASKLQQATERIASDLQKMVLPKGTTPRLVLRVPIIENANVTEVSTLFEKAGYHIVSVEPKQAVIAFKNDQDLKSFHRAIQTYKRGPKVGINPNTKKQYESTACDVLEFIEPDEMRSWQREDRIGKRLSKEIGQKGEQVNAQKKYIVDIDLWHTGDRTVGRSRIEEIRRFITESGEDKDRILDEYIGESLLLAKVSITGNLLNQLLNLDVIAEVELPPIASFDPMQAHRATAKDFPRCPTPPEDGPRACVIDSGIASNHPLLAANVGHEEAILTKQSSPADQNGHGTMVAGVTIFGDVRSCYESRNFASQITLFSARVLNDQNRFDDEKLMINQMREAIETFVKPPYNCRVFNLSLGSDDPADLGERNRQTIWAAALDVLARELKVLLVVSAGNYNRLITRIPDEAERVMNEYPKFLLDTEFRLCDPATSAIAITVGGLAQYEDVGGNDIKRSIASPNHPTPTTRVGPGLNRAIKPEFVHYAGNLVFEGFGSSRRRIHKDPANAIMSFSHQPTKQLFAYDVGTSFAAPRVTHLAALIHHRLKQQLGKEPHPNLIRAVLANSADIPPETIALLEHTFNEHAAIKVCGYGIPNEDFALNSWERRVTLIAEAVIKPDHFHIFGVPIPNAFREAKGKKTIHVALAYDPPVRRRFDYLGIEMDLLLIRGKSLGEVNDAFKKVAQDEDISEAIGKSYVPLVPKSTSRNGGYSRKKSTLQRCTFTMTREQKDYGDIYWLVVRAEKKWAKIQGQDYAIAVTLAADNPDLYNQIRQRIRQRVRARVRS